MNDRGTFERLSRRSVDEHRQIDFFLDRMSASLALLHPGAPDVEPMRRIAAELESLTERLREHFHHEETELYPSVEDTTAEAATEIRRLKDQHERMTEILEMARIHAQRGEAQDAAPLREDLEGFLRVLRSHERAEEALFEQSLK